MISTRLQGLCFTLLSAWPIGAADSCPWLNAATAGGLLGGEVTVRVAAAPANQEDIECKFEARPNAALQRLTIQVITMKDREADYPRVVERCSPPRVPVRGVGNEAVACALSGKTGHGAQIVGRVRDRAFIVAVDGKTADVAVSRDVAEKAAEQVAGILF